MTATARQTKRPFGPLPVLLFGLFFVLGTVKQVLTLGIGPGPLVADAAQYWQLGADVAAGDWLQAGSGLDYRTPIYPAFLGLVQGVAGDKALLVTAIVQHLLLGAAHLLLAAVCWRLTGSWLAALAAYAATALSLMESWFANLVCTEAWFLLVLVATVGALVMYHQRPSARWAVLFGLLLGLTTLVRPVPKLLWIPWVGIFFLHATPWGVKRCSARVVAGHALAVAGTLLLVLAPWCARNWYLFGEPFLARLPPVNKWQVCFQGGSAARLPVPEGAAGDRIRSLIGNIHGEVEDRYCYAVIAALEKKGLAAREIDELVTAACRDAVMRDPWGFGWPAFKRFVNYWRCTPNGIPYYDIPHQGEFAGQLVWDFGPWAEFQRRLLRNAPAHSLRWNELMTLLSCGGTVALILRRRTRPVGLSLAVMFLYFAAVTSLVEVENFKYRVVLEPCLILAGVCGWLGVVGLGGRQPAGDAGSAMVDTLPYGLALPRELQARDVGAAGAAPAGPSVEPELAPTRLPAAVSRASGSGDDKPTDGA